MYYIYYSVHIYLFKKREMRAVSTGNWFLALPLAVTERPAHILQA